MTSQDYKLMDTPKETTEWTTLMVKIPTADKVRKLAFDRKRKKEANPTTRDTADELIRLGLESLRAARIS